MRESFASIALVLRTAGPRVSWRVFEPGDSELGRKDAVEGGLRG